MSTNDDDEYKVGYGKPPKHTRFKKGCSGNPKGRPKGINNFKTDVLTTLKTPVKVTRDGKSRKTSIQEAAILRVAEQALAGNPRALDRLLGLAQTHNNDVAVSGSGSPDDDHELLEIYRNRILSGAAGSAENKGGSDDVTPMASKDAAEGNAFNDGHLRPAYAKKPEDSSD